MESGKLMQEKLNLMKKIHELSGVSPDMWTGTEGHVYFTSGQGTLLMMKAYPEGFLDEDYGETVEENYVPWYPLEQVLMELPSCLDSGHSLVISQEALYYTQESYGEEYDGKLWTPVNDEDIYLASLKLWLAVLEEDEYE